MRRFIGVALAFVMAAGGVLLALPRPALAHCDNINGPVVTAARQALAEGNVKLILPYVQAGSEAELTAAFDQAMDVRKLGGQAQALADRFFFETAVRLHRQGEGEPYTGLKFDDDYGPALHAAEEALESGSLDEVAKVLTDATADGLRQRYQAVLEARAAAQREGTVAADRERVEAELQFELYVHELYLAATGQPAPRLFFAEQELKAPFADDQGTLLLPLRALVEAAGGTVAWDQASHTATARLNGRELAVQAGQGGARLADGVTLVPANLLHTAFGWSVRTEGGAVYVAAN